MTLAAYLHRIDPFALQLWDGFGIRWYGLSYVVGFVCGYLLIRTLSRRGRTLLEPRHVGDFVLAVAIGTVVGGRLGYCLFYRRELFIDFSSDFPFWGVLAINEGGMASHGGILGIAVACAYFAWRHGPPLLHLLDLTALASTIGIFFGRIANFVNGELIGRPASPNLPWAVKFPQEIIAWLRPEHPMHDRLSSPQFQQVEEMVREASAEPITGAGEMVHQIITQTQTNEAVAEAVRPLLTPRHPSQLYEALLEGAVLFVLLMAIWARPRKPGVIAGWFLIAYAAVRIIGEQFRMPDAHIGFDPLGLTRGQWLSILMLAIGVVCLLIWSRRQVEPVGGWAGPALPPAGEEEGEEADRKGSGESRDKGKKTKKTARKKGRE